MIDLGLGFRVDVIHLRSSQYQPWSRFTGYLRHRTSHIGLRFLLRIQWPTGTYATRRAPLTKIGNKFMVPNSIFWYNYFGSENYFVLHKSWYLKQTVVLCYRFHLKKKFKAAWRTGYKRTRTSSREENSNKAHDLEFSKQNEIICQFDVNYDKK